MNDGRNRSPALVGSGVLLGLGSVITVVGGVISWWCWRGSRNPAEELGGLYAKLFGALLLYPALAVTAVGVGMCVMALVVAQGAKGRSQ